MAPSVLVPVSPSLAPAHSRRVAGDQQGATGLEPVHERHVRVAGLVQPDRVEPRRRPRLVCPFADE
jgi:hypothetical protein